MELLECTPTQYVNIPISNPSSTRGIYVQYGYKLFNSNLLHDKYNPPLINLMGFTGTQYDWTSDFLSLLSKHRCVITVDHRGIGDSHLVFNDKINLTSHHKPNANIKRPIPKFSLYDLAEDVYKLITYLKIDRINVCGISMGGYIAQCLTVMYPQIIVNLILIATAPTNFKKLPYQNMDGNKHLTQGFVERNKIKNENDLRIYLRKTMIIDSGNNMNNLNMDTLEKCIDYAIKIKSPFKTIIGQLKAMEQWNGMENLQIINDFSIKFGFNIDIIHGDKDLMVNAKNGEFMSRKLEKSEFYLLRNEGHLIHITKRGLVMCTNIINNRLCGSVNKKQLTSKL
eukprot:179905_1